MCVSDELPHFAYVPLKGQFLGAAESCYRRALALAPRETAAHCGLGLVLWQLGRHDEALACYRAAGIEFVPEEELRQRVQSQIRLAEIEGHSRGGGSSWQSLRRGLPSIEADFLNGEIVLLGALHGVPTPYNRLLQTVANQMAAAGKPPGSMRIEELQGMLAESHVTRK